MKQAHRDDTTSPSEHDDNAAVDTPRRAVRATGGFARARGLLAPVAVAVALTTGAGALVATPKAEANIDAVAASATDRATTTSRTSEREPVAPATTKPAATGSFKTPVVKPKAETQSASSASASASVSKKAAAKSSARTSASSSSASVKVTASRKYTRKRVLGLQPEAMVVYNAVMSRWGSQINSVGGYRRTSRSVHQYGRAIDFMLTPRRESRLGWSVAKYVAANHRKFGVDHIIFEQKIWTPYRPYWRRMENRGSITANHYDHVHVAVKNR